MQHKALLATLVLGLSYLFLQAPVQAAGNAPAPGTRYECFNGSWKTITFHVNGSGDLRRGTCDLIFPNGTKDRRKCDIAWHNNSPNWEFTLVREGQCKNMYVRYYYGVRFLHFESCESLQNTFCVPR